LTVAFWLLGYGSERFSIETRWQPGPRDPGVLRLVTWNLGSASGATGAALRDEHLDRIAESLVELGPDLVLLQELRDGRQFGELQARLRRQDPANGSWSGIITERGGRRLAALARQGNLTGKGRSFGASRPLLQVQFDHPGQPLVSAVILHADAFSAEKRNQAIGFAVDFLFETSPGGHRILAGDLNLDVDVNKRRDLFSDDDRLDVETYNYVALRLEDVGSGMGSTARPDRRLDYLFADPDHFESVGAAPWPGQRFGDMDHDPVVADLLAVLPPE
jgi:endonuclease/exonuclease/phosphatase family metal-dependent hydrolase